MAKFCRVCNQFKGGVTTCIVCKLSVCKDCRISNVCKDCYLVTNQTQLIGEYYNESDKKIVV